MDHIRERLGILEKSIDIAGAYADKSTAFTRDGIGEIAAVDAGNLEIHILHLAPEEAAELLIGVAASQADLHAGVATLHMVDSHLIPA